ncbi:hypothetical protein GCM10011325_22780 [Dyadobacter sediminis]|nr:hypothetical protein GCM10011325_22780 [Dyadobacter sediminis]
MDGKKQINVSKIIGYILLTPPVISVLAFMIEIFLDKNLLRNVVRIGVWNGFVAESGQAAYTTALPFYFGLMAIAGAYLVKDNSGSSWNK